LLTLHRPNPQHTGSSDFWAATATASANDTASASASATATLRGTLGLTPGPRVISAQFISSPTPRADGSFSEAYHLGPHVLPLPLPLPQPQPAVAVAVVDYLAVVFSTPVDCSGSGNVTATDSGSGSGSGNVTATATDSGSGGGCGSGSVAVARALALTATDWRNATATGRWHSRTVLIITVCGACFFKHCKTCLLGYLKISGGWIISFNHINFN
jgi:hypothetical protein